MGPAHENEKAFVVLGEDLNSAAGTFVPFVSPWCAFPLARDEVADEELLQCRAGVLVEGVYGPE